MAGAELNDIPELLEHKDMKMTWRYAHLSPKHREKVINILDRVFDRSQISPQAEKVVQLMR
jgi:site-specific recombinase XerD